MEHLIDPRLLQQRVHVHLVGVGGNGAQIAARLARLDIAMRALRHPEGLRVTAWDPDEVSEANVGRQLYCPSDVGRYTVRLSISTRSARRRSRSRQRSGGGSGIRHRARRLRSNWIPVQENAAGLGQPPCEGCCRARGRRTVRRRIARKADQGVTRASGSPIALVAPKAHPGGGISVGGRTRVPTASSVPIP